MRVAFLTGSGDRSVRDAIERVCQQPGVQPVGILLDTARTPVVRRFRNLWRSIGKHGWSYIWVRFLESLVAVTDRLVRDAAAEPADVDALLRRAFPDCSWTLEDVARKYGMAVHEVGSLNSELAASVLRERNADLGVVVGTRILKPETFSVPRLGSINLHKGKVPEYRGMPPGFWELYDGAETAGVTVHFIDKGLDTGDVVAESTIPIDRLDTPDSLLEKLHAEGARVLASAVAAIRDGKAERRPQTAVTIKARTSPARAEVQRLMERLPHWEVRNGAGAAARNLYLLFVYYSGIYSLVRAVNRLGHSRGSILLYHRVNGYSRDVLTVDPETFASQLTVLASRCRVVTTSEIVSRIRDGRPLEPGSVAIHFDDCYADILTNGAPLLKAAGLPACAFISTGFLGSDRRFLHDIEKSPFHFPNLDAAGIRRWIELGFEIGGHTVNHIDLGQQPAEVVRAELVRSGEELRSITGKPVELFSYPFGGREHITGENRGVVRETGYRALFSAYGGSIVEGCGLWDIPRMGASHETPALYCLLMTEGLTPGQMVARFRRAQPSHAAGGKIRLSESG